MRISAIILSVCLCGTAIFAAPEKPPSPREVREAEKAREKKRRAGSQKGASADRSQAAASSPAPFGTLIRTESAEAAEQPEAELPLWLFDIEEKGANVTISKKTPFGVTSYTKPKTELTEQERDLVERHRAAKAHGSLSDAKQSAQPAMPIPKKQDPKK